MPIYEFFCPKNRRIYSFFARSLSYSSKTPRCPDGPEWPMEKMVSGFAITGRAREKSDLPGADTMDDPRMERAMAEMEREFSSMGDSENPDPRMLARMMRRMSELGGANVPPAMQEMIARLEKGEDPEKIEAEFGDAMDDLDASMGDSPEGQAVAATLRKRRTSVTRDPKLYEMSDFCE